MSVPRNLQAGPPDMSLSLPQLDRYIEALLLNATALTKEARILFDAGACARAYALAHFAREELAKVMMLEATGIRMLAGHPVDLRTLSKRLRDHKAKLRVEIAENALFCAASGAPDQAEKMIYAGCSVADVRNENKNASLYVGLGKEDISEPSKRITTQNAMRTIRLAELSLKAREETRRKMGAFESRSPISIPVIEPTLEGFLALGELYSRMLGLNNAGEE